MRSLLKTISLSVISLTVQCKILNAGSQVKALPITAGMVVHTPAKVTLVFRWFNSGESSLTKLEAQAYIRRLCAKAAVQQSQGTAIKSQRLAGEGAYFGADALFYDVRGEKGYGFTDLIVALVPANSQLIQLADDYAKDWEAAKPEIWSDEKALVYPYGIKSFLPSLKDPSVGYPYSLVVRDPSFLDMDHIQIFRYSEANLNLIDIPKPADLLDAISIAFTANMQHFAAIAREFIGDGVWQPIVADDAKRLYLLALRFQGDFYGPRSFDLPTGWRTTLASDLRTLVQTGDASVAPSSTSIDLLKRVHVFSDDLQPTTMADFVTATIAGLETLNPGTMARVTAYFDLFNYIMAETVSQSMLTWEEGPAPVASNDRANAADDETDDGRQRTPTVATPSVETGEPSQGRASQGQAQPGGDDSSSQNKK